MRVFSTYLFPNYSTVENFIPIGTSSYRVKKSTVEKMENCNLEIDQI